MDLPGFEKYSGSPFLPSGNWSWMKECCLRNLRFISKQLMILIGYCRDKKFFKKILLKGFSFLLSNTRTRYHEMPVRKLIAFVCRFSSS